MKGILASVTRLPGHSWYSFHHLAFWMASPKVDRHGNSGQTRWLRNDGGSSTIQENTLLKLLQAFQSTVEAEAVAGLGLLVQQRT